MVSCSIVLAILYYATTGRILYYKHDKVYISNQSQNGLIDTTPVDEEKHPTRCIPVKNIYYVKIHKTGSTTFQDMLDRFGLRHDLKFALFKCPYQMPYPHPPYASMLEGLEFEHVGDGQRPYNILKDHSMYNRQAAMEYMPDDTQVISLIRHPFTHLVSSFNFFHLPKRFNMSDGITDHVKEFLSRPEFYDKGRMSYSCKPDIIMSHTQNPQSHHLGWKMYNTSAGMEEWLATLDEELSLVCMNFFNSILKVKQLEISC